MKTEIKKLQNSKAEIYFELLWQEFEKYYQKALGNFNQEISLPGFRPGKAPQALIEQKVGEYKILEQALEEVLQDNYPRFIEKENLEPVSQPKVEVLKLAKGNELKCRVIVEVLPDVKLADYKKIVRGIKRDEFKVEEQEVKEALLFLQKSKAKFEDLDRASQKDDFVEITYQSPQIENSKQFDDRFFLGKGKFVPGFEENLENMKAGEEKEFRVVFPKDYFEKDLVEKLVCFKLKMNKVQKAILPEINDEFARSLGKFEGIMDLKQIIEQGIAKEKEAASKEKWRSEVLAKIAENSGIEIPEGLLNQEKARLLKQASQDVQERLAISFDEYLKDNFKSDEEFHQKLHKQAEAEIKNFLVLKEIARKENIDVDVSDSEVEQACNTFLQRISGSRGVENQIDLDTLKSYHKDVLFNDKVFKKLESFT